jgi:hypothetical protein
MAGPENLADDAVCDDSSQRLLKRHHKIVNISAVLFQGLCSIVDGSPRLALFHRLQSN